MNPQLHIVKASLLLNHCHLEHIFGREFYIYLHINPFTVQIKFKNESIKKSFIMTNGKVNANINLCYKLLKLVQDDIAHFNSHFSFTFL